MHEIWIGNSCYFRFLFLTSLKALNGDNQPIFGYIYTYVYNMI